MKNDSKPEIKVKEVELQHLMAGSGEDAYDILQDNQNPEISESKMIDTIFEWLGQ